MTDISIYLSPSGYQECTNWHQVGTKPFNTLAQPFGLFWSTPEHLSPIYWTALVNTRAPLPKILGRLFFMVPQTLCKRQWQLQHTVAQPLCSKAKAGVSQWERERRGGPGKHRPTWFGSIWKLPEARRGDSLVYVGQEMHT